MKKSGLLLVLLALIIASCENFNNQKQVESINYSDQNVLDSLIKVIPDSNDTIFLGFLLGMSKTEYRNHIHKLRNDGLSITFSQTNRFSNIAGTFELGSGYTFNTAISANIPGGKTITGQGRYFLEPLYNNDDKLLRLNILSVEKWTGDYGYRKPNWFQNRIAESTTTFNNDKLKQAMIDNQIISSYNFIQQKGNLVIFERSGVFSYVHLKTLLSELLVKAIEKELIEEKNQNITF